MGKGGDFMIKKETVTKADLLKVLDLMETSGMRYWLDGGWGVDVLLGKQTREHRDVDINFDARYTDALLRTLVSHGYEITTDWRPVRIELCHPELSYVDIHPFVINEDGTAKQADGMNLRRIILEARSLRAGQYRVSRQRGRRYSIQDMNSGKWISMISALSTICSLPKAVTGMRQGELYAGRKNS